MNTAYERIVDALRANGKRVVERDGSRAMAQCPAHDDQNPSLSIGLRQDGKGVVLNCHANCAHRDVLDAVGLTEGDLFDDVQLRAAYRSTADYTYPGGRVVHRKPDKSFPQSGNKTDRTLFGVDHVMPGENPVYVPEGEKDVLAAQSVGAVAVCSAMGAGKAHLADWSALKGHDVIVVADRDEPGRKHALDIASIVGRIAKVRIVEAKTGKDLADHIAAGLSLDELVPINPTAQNGVASGEQKKSKDPAVVRPFDVVTLSDVKPEKVSWLWKGRLPVGKLVTLDGDPGLGKSTLALTFAAIISSGGKWPDGELCGYTGDVVLMSAEDGLADTVRPRFDSAGGDPTRVHAVQGVPLSDNPDDGMRLPTLADIEQLRETVCRTAARLVIIDVLMAYLPTGVDSHRDQDIRQVLGRLARLADDTGCTVLMLRHLTKEKGGDPLYRGGGSIGIVGAARVGLLVAKDPDDETLCVLAPVKNNLSAPACALAYRVVEDELRDVSHINWIGATDHTAEELLSDTSMDVLNAVDEAKDWLEDYLKQRGRVRSKDAKTDGKEQGGFSEAALKRAASKLKVVAQAEGYPRFTYWSLPLHSRLNPLSTRPTELTEPTGSDVHKPKTGREPTERQSAQSAQSAQSDECLKGEPTERFQPPSGAGRCHVCGWHIATQGHKPDCSANTEGQS